MKQSRRTESSQFVVKTATNGKPIIVDTHNKKQKIVCGFNCFVLAYNHCNRMNKS